MISEKTFHNFHRALQTWFCKHGRDLPWRRTRDPYAVLVSEFMLQQTTVAAVIPYFERWMKEFPNVKVLAEAEEQDVLRFWQGLGYYSRAKNLHRTAQEVVRIYEGNIPRDITTLCKLPGVGAYTAAAIAAFAFDECVPVLDANIIRIVARLFNYRRLVTSANGRKFLQQAARSLLPSSNGHAHTAALMDLGARICRAREPLCDVCPVRPFCKARCPANIPVKPPRAPLVREIEYRVFAQKDNVVYLVPSTGPRWEGLWVFPRGRPSPCPLITLTYTLTRHRVRLEVMTGSPESQWIAFPQNQLPPMPAPHLRALRQILSEAAPT